MKSSKNQEKKLYFSYIKHGIIIILAISLVIFLFSISKNVDQGKKLEHEKVIKEYVKKMDSLYNENLALQVKQEEIQKSLEKIYSEQKVLSNKHEFEIKVIYNASADEHAKWFCSKVDSLERNSELYNSSIK